MIGRRLGPYEILGEISRGGMGVVYRARDLDLGREVALKLLPEALTHDTARRERMLQEARAASALEHPHIAVIHGVGDADGITYIAMELIRGEKLSDTVARGALQPRRALDLAIEVAEGLTRAHDTDVVHRDLKPANVMVTEDGHAKIIDFGLAKLLPASSSSSEGETVTDDRLRTAPGQVLGTVAYMSPEQARGTPLDHRTDIFSFGVLLFELVTGHRPFTGPTEADTLQAILSQPIPPLPARPGLPPEVASGLERVIAKCVEKDPDERYQTIKDVVVDLRAIRRQLESTTVSRAVPTGSASPRSARLAWLVGVALVVAAVAWTWGPGTTTSPPVSSDGKPAVAVMYFENQTGDDALDWMRTGLADMLVTDLSQDATIEVLGTDRLYEILDELGRANDQTISAEVVRQVADRAGVDRVLVGSYIRAGDTIRINARLQEAGSGRIVTSERVEGLGESSLFSLVDELTRRIKSQMARMVAGPGSLLERPGDPEERGLDRGVTEITTSSIEAYRYYAEGINLHERFLEAQAVLYFERAIEIDPNFAMAFAKLAVVSGNLGLGAQRDEYARRALDNRDRLTTRERYYIEGYYYSGRPDTYERGIQAYEQGLALHPEHQASRHNLAGMYTNLERYDKAIEHLEELVRRGTPNPSTYGGLAQIHIRQRNTLRALEIVEDFTDRFPENASGYVHLGEVLVAAGRLTEADAAYVHAQALDPQGHLAQEGRITVALLERRWADAEALLAEMAESTNPARRRSSFLRSATVELFHGRSARALDLMEQAVRMPGTSLADRVNTLVAQSALLRDIGRTALALSTAESAVAGGQGSFEHFAALFTLVRAQIGAGRYSDAERALATIETMMQVIPETPIKERILGLLRGRLALESGDPEAAIAHLLNAEGLLTPRGVPGGGGLVGPAHISVRFLLASAYLAAGQDEEAADWLQGIVDATDERAGSPIPWVRSHYLLAQIRERQGDTARARELYARFLDNWGDGDMNREWVADARQKVGA